MMIGLVLEFKYLKGKTFKEKEFSKSSAPVRSVASKDIGVLCNFFKYNNAGVLSSITQDVDGDKHTFVNIATYVGTIREPNYANKVLTISPKLLTELAKLSNLKSDFND